LRPPIVPMLARPVDALPGPDSCAGGCAYEPKFDGWRCIVFRQRRGAYLQSRAGRPLAGFFPEIARICREVLPVGVVVDGELVVWEPEAGRTSFALLQRRVSAGRRVLQFARQHPAHLVVFDLLQMGELPVLEAPLVDRRGRLAALLGDAPNQLTLCPQTVERDRTVEWFATMTSAGVEGLVIKALSSAYQPGRPWLVEVSVEDHHRGDRRRGHRVDQPAGGVAPGSPRRSGPAALRRQQAARIRSPRHSVPSSRGRSRPRSSGGAAAASTIRGDGRCPPRGPDSSAPPDR
jgi:hypothetical protein